MYATQPAGMGNQNVAIRKMSTAGIASMGRYAQSRQPGGQDGFHRTEAAGGRGERPDRIAGQVDDGGGEDRRMRPERVQRGEERQDVAEGEQQVRPHGDREAETAARPR